jgi:hypothetical protein
MNVPCLSYQQILSSVGLLTLHCGTRLTPSGGREEGKIWESYLVDFLRLNVTMK